jgi:hypothetical protein
MSRVPPVLQKVLSAEFVDFILPEFEAAVGKTIQQLNKEQAEALSVEIAAWFVAGLEGDQEEDKKKKKDKKGKNKNPDDGLSDLQRETVRKMTDEKFGYISQFNKTLGDQLAAKAQEILKDHGGKEGGREEVTKLIKDYVEQVFDGSETVVIDRTGQTKQVIEVGKDKKLKLVDHVITRAYHASPETYSTMLGRSAVHSAYEQGRAEAYQQDGLTMWRFVGPVDERSRPAHSAIVGEHYTYGTDESDLAMSLFDEPNCRHRSIPYFDDPELDTPQEEYDRIKDEAGLHWDEDKEEWAFEDKSSRKKTETKKKTEPKKKTETKPGKKKEKKPEKKSKEDVLKELEDEIRGRTLDQGEKGYVINKDGEIVLSKVGVKNGIQFTPAELKLFKNQILTHSHPFAGSFSPDDICLSCYHELNEMRAAGKYRTYVMKVKDGKSFYPELWIDKVRPIYNSINLDVRSEFEEAITKGTMPIDKATVLHWHEVWRRVAEMVPELDYSFIEVGEKPW